jgi:hypothetical protein
MGVELDPERLYLLDELRSLALSWVFRKSMEIPEIQNAMDQSGVTEDMVREAVLSNDNMVGLVGPEFEHLYDLALGTNGRIDAIRLERELRRDRWPIRWGVVYETRIAPVTPRNLYQAVAAWCTVVLRDRVLPDVRKAINEQIPSEFSTVLRIGSAPGLQRTHDISFTVATRSTRRFSSVIARHHGNGAIGLAGPRGAGKTTLIERYVSGLTRRGEWRTPVAVSVACPVDYDARDFVLHLHATLCRAILAQVARDRPHQMPFWRGARFALKRVASIAFVLVAALLVGAAAVWTVVPVDFSQSVIPQLVYPKVGLSWWMMPSLLIAAYMVVIIFGILMKVLRGLTGLLMALPAFLRSVLSTAFEYRSLRREGITDGQLLGQTASTHLRQIRLLQTSTTGWSGKLAVPFGADVSTAKSVQLAERPLTYPEVVESFRGLISHCVEILGEMVIAIDEVDKIASAQKAQAFINDIKGIFGVPGCLYLVSVSEDALVTFDRTGLGIRDAFDSAFDEIVVVEYLSLADSLELLRSRVIGISEPFGFLCHCLSGGLPRELIRAVRRITEHRSAEKPVSLATVCQELIRDEITVRENEFRILANRIDMQSGTAILEPFVHLALDPCAKDLLELTSSLIRRRTPDAMPVSLGRLRIEAAMLAYHCATIQEVFTDELDEETMRRARDDPSFPGSFDQLGRARNAIAQDPQLAGALIDEFRHAWRLRGVPGR